MTSTLRTRSSYRLLRTAMRVDAVGGVLAAVPFLALSGHLDAWTGMPRSFHLGLGVLFLVYGLVFYPLAGRPRVRPAGIAIVTCNAVFTVLFLGLAVASTWPLTGWGYALLLGGALYTAVIGGVQYVGLTR